MNELAVMLEMKAQLEKEEFEQKVTYRNAYFKNLESYSEKELLIECVKLLYDIKENNEGCE